MTSPISESRIDQQSIPAENPAENSVGILSGRPVHVVDTGSIPATFFSELLTRYEELTTTLLDRVEVLTNILKCATVVMLTSSAVTIGLTVVVLILL